MKLFITIMVSGLMLFTAISLDIPFHGPVYAQQPSNDDNIPPDGDVPPADNAGDNVPPPPPTTSGTSSKAGQYPPIPGAFRRGNYNPSGTSPAGFYISMVKFMPLLFLFMGWVYASKWSYEDGHDLKVRPMFWTTVILASGVVGLFLAMHSKWYILTLLLGIAGCVAPVGVYIKERNERVPESSKVLTPRHIKKVLIRSLAKIGIKIGSSQAVEKAIGPPLRFIGKSSTSNDRGNDRSKQVETSKGYLAAKELVYDGILRRATDIHLEPKEDELSVRLRIDGVMYPTEPFDRATGDSIVNIFKVLGAMDITEKRRPQDGSFRAELDLREIDFRVATQGTRFGEKMSLRILDQSNSVNTLSQLGLRPQLQEKIKTLVNVPHGLFLSCGPTGAGKSTTLYSCLSEIDAFQRNIITVEDPIEYKMDNVTQIEINTKTGQSFGTALRSILRQDPDVVMIGEIRDQETGSYRLPGFDDRPHGVFYRTRERYLHGVISDDRSWSRAIHALQFHLCNYGAKARP